MQTRLNTKKLLVDLRRMAGLPIVSWGRICRADKVQVLAKHEDFVVAKLVRCI